MQERERSEGTVDFRANMRGSKTVGKKKDNVFLRYTSQNVQISLGSSLLYDQCAQKREKQVFMHVQHTLSESTCSVTRLFSSH